ncbi:MAG: hypothetical protein ACYCPW_03230 [Nitrososphaerales archaeon]
MRQIQNRQIEKKGTGRILDNWQYFGKIILPTNAGDEKSVDYWECHKCVSKSAIVDYE